MLYEMQPIAHIDKSIPPQEQARLVNEILNLPLVDPSDPDLVHFTLVGLTPSEMFHLMKTDSVTARSSRVRSIMQSFEAYRPILPNTVPTMTEMAQEGADYVSSLEWLFVQLGERFKIPLDDPDHKQKFDNIMPYYSDFFVRQDKAFRAPITIAQIMMRQNTPNVQPPRVSRDLQEDVHEILKATTRIQRRQPGIVAVSTSLRGFTTVYHPEDTFPYGNNPKIPGVKKSELQAILPMSELLLDGLWRSVEDSNDISDDGAL